jgi:hypothetical protein
LSVPKCEVWLTDPANVADLLTVKISHLSAAYKDVEKDLNITSMSLYSGPAKQHAGLPRTRTGHWHVRSNGERTAWLGTGDAELGNSKRRARFLMHYRAHLGNVLTLALPHHGSDANFHRDLALKVRANFFVAASDDFQNWKHPGTRAVQTIASTGKFVSNVTSSVTSRFEETIDFP